MKKLLVLITAVLAFSFAGRSQSMNCGNFCVLGINNIDTIGNNTLDVIIWNADTNFVNYPIVVVTNSLGDTVANINSLFYFFGHPAGDTVTHTIPTSLDSIPTGFTGTVYFTDALYSLTCSYSYPMSCTVGINETYTSNTFSVYPNPASDRFNIDLKNIGSIPARVTIYDATGRAVRSVSTTEKSVTIERGDLRSGMYFVDVLIAEKRSSKKIIFK